MSLWEEIELASNYNRPPPLVDHRMFRIGKMILVLGGFTKSDQDLSQSYTFDSETQKWGRAHYGTDSPTLKGLIGHSAVRHRKNLYVYGTNGLVVFQGATAEGYQGLGISEKIVSNGGSPPPSIGHSAVIYKNEMYIYGGTNPEKKPSILFSYRFDDGVWTEITSFGPAPPVSYHSAAVHGDSMFIFGGSSDASFHNDVHRYFFPTKTWQRIDVRGIPPTPRSRQTGILFRDTFLLIWGGSDAKTFFNDTHLFNMATSTWEDLTDLRLMLDAPSARRDHSACLGEKRPVEKMYIFGGKTSNSAYADPILHTLNCEPFPMPGVNYAVVNGFGTLHYAGKCGKDLERSVVPTQIDLGSNWTRISCQDDRVAALDTDGRILTWSDTFQLETIPTILGKAKAVDVLASKETLVLSITNAGEYKISKGGSDPLQVELAATSTSMLKLFEISTSTFMLKQVESGRKILGISSGQNHVIFFDQVDAYAMGTGCFSGELGIAGTTECKSPVKIPEISGRFPHTLACGKQHTLIGVQSGVVYAFGNNEHGQLGLGDDVPKQEIPVIIRSLSSYKVAQVSAGECHSACLCDDGRVFTFGLGTLGRLGHGSERSEKYPRQIPNLEVVQVECGNSHTMFICKTSPFNLSDMNLGIFSEISRDIFILEILSKLKTSSLLKLCQVSKDFEKFVSSDLVWDTFIQRNSRWNSTWNSRDFQRNLEVKGIFVKSRKQAALEIQKFLDYTIEHKIQQQRLQALLDAPPAKKSLRVKIGEFFTGRGSQHYRVLMLGLDAAGKTTILYKLKSRERNSEVITTIPTIGFNVEEVDLGNRHLTVWDVGGPDKIRPVQHFQLEFNLKAVATLHAKHSSDDIRSRQQ
eukprot:TRINITY_DN4691_c0_g1_i3.p1 TRINITY_DN4691_c0_g1~~TRINITY_DN4691_c0_g1_i3.p1  ORF type:complete len:863 (-),score=257.83 TRINITY_DN4691_c0_g1_i3:309-2897(-)